ncbi:MAG: hypothetical protein GEEBNDBF_01724 [bacterium]|nr:hypothetical protein [bacterium]
MTSQHYLPGQAVDLERAILGEERFPESEKIEMRQALDVAQLIYDLRTARGLTQKELARLVGTTQPVISRLEDADYRGHSLTMLQRIAAALGLQVQLRLVPGPSGVHPEAVQRD